ncbi:hypothetical protein J2W30_000113 [Variovorax boronicumulans]|uniref:DUF6886 family protein n=1 Tax=Variovorax TaxID=34072 RepID=UPI0027800D8A|nr:MULTISPECIES: DUF6886 family protein [Variovorax]MDQ0032372.1 hypothetical protein [Variovorax boronicumulans]MDQ0040210.1 hypothetical protein [Variovorax boronicumulans]MDQ0609835.1 hypothetical protein [Variovorax sp. W1I1]
MRLFHFSDKADIDRFVPRPVQVPAERRQGLEWLNGPLVWAIAQAHQHLYLFPRECPRVVIRAAASATDTDRKAWLGDLRPGMSSVAYIEERWVERFERAELTRYELPSDTFTDIQDAGMWVSRETVVPSSATRTTDLRSELQASRTELRVVESLVPLKPVWESSLQASGIRLRNAVGWQQTV